MASDLDDHRRHLPQNQPGYKHKSHRYNHSQKQRGGSRFTRYCKRGHDKLEPHGLASDGSECAVCKRVRWNAYYKRRVINERRP